MDIKGFAYGYNSTKGQYRSEEGVYSQDRLFETGINYMCLAFAVEQKTYSSTEILFDYRYNVSEKDLAFTIQRAHEKGIKVCLKPMVNCKDGVWRALINFPDETMNGEDKYWNAWFESYSAYILHYAEFAQDHHIEMFCIGCEMLGTERKEDHWRNLIHKVRNIYQGLLVYNTNHGKEQGVSWFDSLDYIGTSAYYPVAKGSHYNLVTMRSKWKEIAEHLETVSAKFEKPILFMEIGCRSARGCAKIPWDFIHKEYEFDEGEQATFYESCLMELAHKEWFAGVFWWDWSTVIYHTREEALKEKGFNIHLKKAEDIIKKWYSK